MGLSANAKPPGFRLSFWNLFKQYYTNISDLPLLLKLTLNLMWNFWTVTGSQSSKSQDPHFDGELDTPENQSTGEIQIVMDRLGIPYDPKQTLGIEEIAQLFEEEPNLEEMKEAFDVFDENRDGFIDGKDLYRVLLSLGLDVGSEKEAHARMIEAADKNGDGLVDFNEFVQFMEKVFS